MHRLLVDERGAEFILHSGVPLLDAAADCEIVMKIWLDSESLEIKIG